MDEEKATAENSEEKAEEVDYKAKFEEERAHSRKWEKLAKANKAAADELEELKQSQLSESERLKKQLDAATAELDGLRAANERAAWVAEVSKDTGVPAEVLQIIETSDRDDLAEKAARIAGLFSAPSDQGKGQTVPVVIGDGKHADTPEPPTDFIREQFLKIMH